MRVRGDRKGVAEVAGGATARKLEGGGKFRVSTNAHVIKLPVKMTRWKLDDLISRNPTSLFYPRQ